MMRRARGRRFLGGGRGTLRGRRARLAVAALLAGACLLAVSAVAGWTAPPISGRPGEAPATPIVSPFLVAAIVVGVLGLGALGVGLWLADPRPLPWGIGLLAAAWLVGIWSHDDTWRLLTPAAGAWLLVTADLAYWSLDLGIASVDEPRVLRRRAIRIAGVAAAGAALGVAPLVDVSLAPLTGEALTALAAAAVVTLLAAALALVSSLGERRD